MNEPNARRPFSTDSPENGLRNTSLYPTSQRAQRQGPVPKNPGDKSSLGWKGTFGKKNMETEGPLETRGPEGKGLGNDRERQGATGPHPSGRNGTGTRGNGSLTKENPGALRCRSSRPSTEEKQRSEAIKGDSEDPEAVDKNHSGEDEGPNGFLREEVKGTKKELNVVEEAVEKAYRKYDGGDSSYRQVGLRILCHVYHCQTRFSKFGSVQGGVPIGYKLIKEACRQADGVPVTTRTKNVWAPLKQSGLLRVTEHVYNVGGTGWSRRFLLRDNILKRLSGALWEGCKYESRYNLIDGSRYRRTEKTRLTYDGEHSWSQRSGFIYETLSALRGQRDLVNRDAVIRHLEAQMARCKIARDRYSHLCRQGAHPEKLYEAARELETVRGQLGQDLRIWSDIVAQGLEEAEDMPEGIYQYETAYEVQEASGRNTMKVGLQNASSEMKAAAAKGIPGYRNLDIKSSQTEALIQELEFAESKGADVDPAVLKDYVGKDALADRFGPGRDLWKRPEHAVKFGARFNYESFEAARSAAKGQVLGRLKDKDGNVHWSRLHTLPHETKGAAWTRAVYNELSTMAQVACDWAENEEIGYEDPGEIYDLLERVYGDMAEELASWRVWLIEEFWKEFGQHGSRHGYYVENPCGLAMSIEADRLKDAQTGKVSRYDQEVALATGLLQGREAAFMHALAQLAEEYDYEFLRNEHDGAVVIGKIPDEARRKAREMSGFHRAELEAKPFS